MGGTRNDGVGLSSGGDIPEVRGPFGQATAFMQGEPTAIAPKYGPDGRPTDMSIGSKRENQIHVEADAGAGNSSDAKMEGPPPKPKAPVRTAMLP